MALDVYQRNHSPEERECWSLVKATRKWRTYCRAASEVILITDHNPLEWLRAQKDPRRKFVRWLIELEELPYEILYRNGLDHTVPECLSRAKQTEVYKDLNNDETYFEDRIFAVDILSDEEWLERVLRNAQGDDPAISFALEQLTEKHEIR